MVPFYRVEFHKRLRRKINPDDLKFKVLEAKCPQSHILSIYQLDSVVPTVNGFHELSQADQHINTQHLAPAALGHNPLTPEHHKRTGASTAGEQS